MSRAMHCTALHGTAVPAIFVHHSAAHTLDALTYATAFADVGAQVDELHSATGSERHDLSVLSCATSRTGAAPRAHSVLLLMVCCECARQVRAVVIRHVGEVELAAGESTALHSLATRTIGTLDVAPIAGCTSHARAVERWLGFWLWDDEADKRGGAEVFRTKGVLALRADPSRHFVQVVAVATGTEACSACGPVGLQMRCMLRCEPVAMYVMVRRSPPPAHCSSRLLQGVRELFDTAEGSAWQKMLHNP